MEAKARLAGALERAPVTARGFEQGEGADEVGLDEVGRAIDRAIDVRFGGEMHHRIGAMLRENARDRRRIGDVDDFQRVAPALGERAKRRVRSSIGQLVEIDDLLTLAQQLPHHRCTDEACAAGHQNLGHAHPFAARWSERITPRRHSVARYNHHQSAHLSSQLVSCPLDLTTPFSTDTVPSLAPAR